MSEFLVELKSEIVKVEDGSTLVNNNANPIKIDVFGENQDNSCSDCDLKEPKYVDLQNRYFEETVENCSRKEYDMNPEDESRVNNFLSSSLHNMDGPVSISLSNYIQSSKQSNESDDSDESSSSDEDDVECKICKKTFLNSYDLDLHVKSRRMDDKRYRCCNCQKLFRDNTQLKVHSRKHTGEKPFECTVCGKKFTVNGNLNKHMRIHTGEKRFECTDCGKKFTQFAHLEDHLKTHSGDRPFVCSYCKAAFKTKARLRKHEKSHTSPLPNKRAVSCPQCHIILKSNRQLGAHLLSHIKESDGPFVCQMCGETFTLYIDLQDHQKNHAEMKTFFCEFCDRKFASGSHLRRHMNSHSGFRPHSCDVCNRSFQSSQNMKRHMMTHTGERPYDCPECGKKFLTLENLNRHKRTHTGEKPFACEICGRVFAHSTTAKEHYRAVHTGEKPYQCSLCQQNFAISKMLYRHIRVKHPEYFPQFKKEQAMTPNMKKALNKFKGGINENNIREEVCNLEGKNIEAKIKEEPMEINEKSSDEININNLVCDDFKTEIKTENSDGLIASKIKREFVNDSYEFSRENIHANFIKMEKIEMEDDNC